MRVLATIHPGHGHLNPVVPVLRALVEQGDEVLVATSRSFLPAVEAAGLVGAAAGRDWLESQAATTLPGFLDATVPRQLEIFVQLARESLEEVERLAVGHGADLVLRESMEWSGWVVAERLGLPHAVCGTVVPMGGGLLRDLAGPAFDALLEAAGLPADPGLSRLAAAPYLDLLPRSFTPDWMQPAPRTSYSAPPYDGGGSPPGWLEALGTDRPLVYVSFGTVYSAALPAFGVALEALSAMDVDAVVTLGGASDPTGLGQQRPGVRVERFVPQSAVLARSAVAVTHAGCGTLVGCLRAGVPVVCLPFGADQAFNAARCVELGLGVSLADRLPPGALFPVTDPAGLTAQRVADAVSDVLDAPSYRRRVGELQGELLAAPGVDAAARALRALVGPEPR